jgi:hypothetical protein
VAQHDAGERSTSGTAGEEEIHLPTPTIAPPTVGFGVLLLTFGVAGLSDRAPETLHGLSPILLIVGALFMVLGLAVWLINDAREFSHADHSAEPGGH